MRTPHDDFATRVWRLLFGRRRAVQTHRTLTFDRLEADFWAEPGRRLPAFMGLLSDIAGEALILGESETGDATVAELHTALLKAHLGHRVHVQELKRKQDSRPPGEEPDLAAVLLIIAERVSARAVRRVLKGPQLELREPGFWYYPHTIPVYVISLRELAFREETAAFHLLCRGPKQRQAIRWLLLQGSPEARRYAVDFNEEIQRMQREEGDVHRDEVSDADRRYYRELALLVERTMMEKGEKKGERKGRKEGRQEGRKEGRQEGRKEGRQEALRATATRLWRRRFGAPSPELTARLDACKAFRRLEAVIEDIALAETREEAEATANARLTPRRRP
jgi:hypothetical protein